MNRWLGLSIAAAALAAAVFWTTLVTDPPKTEAETIAKFDMAEVLLSAPQDAAVQDPGVIGCAYVLTDGHRCR